MFFGVNCGFSGFWGELWLQWFWGELVFGVSCGFSGFGGELWLQWFLG